MDVKIINEAMDNRFDGIEPYVIVEELLELEAENKQLKKTVQIDVQMLDDIREQYSQCKDLMEKIKRREQQVEQVL